MAIQDLKGSMFWPMRTHPAVLSYSATALHSSLGLFNDGADAGHMCGTLQWADGGSSKTIAEIGVYIQALSTPVMTLRASIQGVADPTGAAGRKGNGTIGVSATGSAPGGVGAYTFTFTPAGSYSTGDLIAIVVDLTSYTSGTFNLGALAIAGGSNNDPANTFNNGGSNTCTNVILKAGDGTYGTLRGATWVPSAPTYVTYSTDSTYDEYGNVFTAPFKCQVTGVWFRGYPAARGTSLMDARIYSDPLGTPSALATATGASNELWNTTSSAGGVGQLFFAAPITLTAGTQYAFGLRSTAATGSEVNIEEQQLQAANEGTIMPGGTSVYEIRRDAGTGAFAAVNTAYFLVGGIIITGLDDGAGGSGSAGSRSIPLVIK